VAIAETGRPLALPHDAREGSRALTPELRVIFATVRPDDLLLEPALDSRLDADPLLGMAEGERATPFLSRRLGALRRRGLQPDLPDEAWTTLNRLAMVHEFRLLELDQRLSELLGAMQAEGVRVTLLKGAAFVARYGLSPVDRPMGDVDLLVAADDARRAWALARESGWRVRADLPPVEAYEGHHHLPPLDDRTGMNLGLEIHTDLFPDGSPFRLSATSLTSEVREIQARSGAFVPGPEDLLLHAALHLAWSHGLAFGLWKTFLDVRVLVEHDAVDWDRFLERALDQGAGSCAFWTLLLARKWAGIPIDAAVLEALRPSMSDARQALLERHFALSLRERGREEGTIGLRHRLWELAIQPEQQGHGEVRPWSRTEHWIGGDTDPGAVPGGAVEASSGRGTVRSPSAVVRGWRAGRYAFRVLTAR